MKDNIDTINKKDIANSEIIRRMIFDKALNSIFLGIKRKAQEGTDNYNWKYYIPISLEQAQNELTNTKWYKRTIDNVEYYVVTGSIGDNGCFVAARGDDSRMRDYVEKLAENRRKRLEKLVKQQQEDRENIANLDKSTITTTTYDRWKKRHDKNFEAYWNDTHLADNK